MDIHEIQNRVENHLMASDDKAIARAYIEYRHDRDQAREAATGWPRRSVAWWSRPTRPCSTRTPTRIPR